MTDIARTHDAAVAAIALASDGMALTIEIDRPRRHLVERQGPGLVGTDHRRAAQRLDGGELLVGLEAQSLARDIVVGQMGIDRQLDLDLAELLIGLALETRDGLTDEPDIEVETDTGDVAGLLPTCLLYTSPSPRDRTRSRMPSSA